MKRLIIVLIIIVGVYNVFKPLPDGLSILGTEYHVPNESVVFLADKTYVDIDGVRHSEQTIFDEVFKMIENAEHYILIDMFLWNDFQGEQKETTRLLSSELADKLLSKKEDFPDINITIITDPINTVYGGVEPQFIELLRDAGITVIVTDLRDLRDSNPVYSSIWRIFIQWFGNSTRGSIIPHPFASDGGSVTARSYLSLLNFKANHRKLIVADNALSGEPLKMVTLVTSANPHDGSSAHANTAIVVKDYIWKDVIDSEKSTAMLSKNELVEFSLSNQVNDEVGGVMVQLLTEGKIRDVLIDSIQDTELGDTIDISMFYLSDRKVVNAFKDSYERGVKIRLLLDSNKDAFGHQKNGIPNRQVADELMDSGNLDIEIRWCDTHGEQCHSKMILIKKDSGVTLITGSANLTKRNIGDYNLETNILVQGDNNIDAITDAYTYFNEAWNNTGGKIYSVPYDVYEESSIIKYGLYRIMEKAGVSSF